jgi:hypothetical protein
MENQAEEIWKDVVGWEGMYLVSNLGNIRSLDRLVRGPHPEGRIIKGKLRKLLTVKGYLSINLIDKKSGKSTRNSVHRFVAEAFIPNTDNKPEVNHIDGNKKNNKVDNLEWCTRIENVRHAINTGLMKPHVVTEEHKAILRACAIKNQNLLKWQKDNKDKMREMALHASLIQVRRVKQFDKNGVFISQYDSIAEASRTTGISSQNISRCASGKHRTSKGFKWEYA